MKKDNSQRVCFYIDKDLIKKLKFYCLENGLSMSEAVEKLIKGLLKK